MSGTRAISTTSTRELSSRFFPSRQGAEGNARHSDRNISLYPTWSCQGFISTPVHVTAAFRHNLHHPQVAVD